MLLCPVCDGPLRPNTVYCSCRCAAIAREYRRQNHPPPETQGAILLREIDDMRRELAGLREVLSSFEQQVTPILRRLLEQVDAMAGKEPPRLLTSREACQMLHCSSGFLFRLSTRGELKRTRLGKSIRYKMSELQRYMDRKTK